LSHGTVQHRHSVWTRRCHLPDRIFITSAIACWCVKDGDNVRQQYWDDAIGQ